MAETALDLGRTSQRLRRGGEASSPAAVSPDGQHELFLDTSSEEALGRWDDLLRLQVDFFAKDEMDFLAGFPPWRGASDILDLGCGNGRYISALRSNFPDKSYTGIDISEGLIAQARLADPAVAFHTADFLGFEADRSFDLIVMRFVVQHLTDFAAVLAGCARLLCPFGAILIIEPELAASRNSPPTPHFKRLLMEFQRCRDENSRMKTRINEPRHLLDGVPGWKLAADQPILISHSGSSARMIAEKLYFGWIDMIESSGLLAYEFEATRRELRSWASNSGARSEIALRAVVIENRTSR